MPSDRVLALFRHALFTLHPVDSGCPALYAVAPFGGRRPLLDRIAEILGEPAPSSPSEVERAIDDYVALFASFADIVRHVELRPGPQRVVDVSAAIERLSAAVDAGTSSVAEAEAAYARALETSFAGWERDVEITDTSLAMARHAVWQMEDRFSVVARDADAARRYLVPYLTAMHAAAHAPENAAMLFEHPIVCGDGKRPYGDLTYYYRDLERLGVPGIAADEPSPILLEPAAFSAREQERIDRMQRDLYLVLQAMAQSIAPLPDSRRER